MPQSTSLIKPEENKKEAPIKEKKHSIEEEKMFHMHQRWTLKEG